MNVVGKIPTMAFIVSRPNGTWEARESRRTPDGPRARTLATFREFTPEVAAQIAERSSVPVDRDDLVRKASRSGAPVITSEIDRAAADLLRQLALGGAPRKGLASLLADSFGTDGKGINHEGERMKLWAGATYEERAQALGDLLDLGEALPVRAAKGAKNGFPRISST